MQYHEWQTKYERLLNAAKKYAHYQMRYQELKAAADKRQMQHWRRELKTIAKDYEKEKELKQGALL